jgi:hypothetical protein
MNERGLSAPDKGLKSTTVYRFLHAQNLMRPPESQKQDRRKFEAELPNDIWQSDVMHGPMVTVGERKRKSYLIAFIDDHSRLIPYARFYLSEKLASQKTLRRQWGGLQVEASGAHHGIPGHRLDPCKALQTGGQGEDRAVVQNRTGAIFDRSGTDEP